MTLGELAIHEGVAPPTITGVVARLEADGNVEREPDPTDRRVVRVTASARGRSSSCGPRAQGRLAHPTHRRADPRRARPPGRRPRRHRGVGREGRTVSALGRATATPSGRSTPELPPLLHRPAHLPGRQLADDGRPDPARAPPHRQRRRGRLLDRLPVRARAAPRRRGPAWSPTAPTSASCCSSCSSSPWCSRSRWPPSPSWATRRCWRSSPSRSPAASPSPSTTRPGGPSSSRWCPRTT